MPANRNFWARENLLENVLRVPLSLASARTCNRVIHAMTWEQNKSLDFPHYFMPGKGNQKVKDYLKSEDIENIGTL